MHGMFGDDGDSTMEDKTKATVNSIIEQSQGVSAWKDLAFKVGDDGKIVFSGTAYFKKLSSLKIGSMDFSAKPKWKMTNG